MTEVISQELKYDTLISNHSSIQYRNTSPQNSTTITTSITSSTGPTEWVISPACFNPSKSRLEFTLQLAAGGASNYNFVNANLLSTISRLVVYDSGTNAVLVDTSNFEKYASLMSPAGTSFTDFLHKANGAGIGSTEASAQLISVEDIGRFIGVNATGNLDGDGSVMASYNPLFGRQQFYIGATNTASFVDVSIPFSAFKGTVLNTNKVLYFPTNLVIQIYWNANNQYAFLAQSATDPTSTPASLATAVTINNMNIALACESNLSIISQVIQTTMNSGITFQIPYPTVTRQAVASSTAHSYSLQLTRAYGSKILFLLSAPFTNAGSNNTANTHSRGTITVYNTYLNNIAIKYPPSFNALKSEDYMIGNKEYLKGSVIQNIGEYVNSDWMHCDSFFGEKGINEIDFSMIDGLDVGTASSTWQLQATLSAGTAYTWITIIMGVKTLNITSVGSSVM